jgi:hypothetical protein
MEKKNKRLITKSFLKRYGFREEVSLGFWYNCFFWSDSYYGLAFRYKYDEKTLETQEQHYLPHNGEINHYNEKEAYELIKEYGYLLKK